MRLFFLPLLSLVLIMAHLALFSAQSPVKENPITDKAKEAAFKVLQTKCNVCHKKQNPFKIFSLRNMERHASKIHEQVFVLKRMPKPNGLPLTEAETSALTIWLTSLGEMQAETY